MASRVYPDRARSIGARMGGRPTAARAGPTRVRSRSDQVAREAVPVGVAGGGGSRGFVMSHPSQAPRVTKGRVLDLQLAS